MVSVLLMFIAAKMGGSRGRTLGTNKPFRAKAGMQRKNARPIVVKSRKTDKSSRQEGSGGEKGSGDEEEADEPTEGEKAIAQALQAPTMEEAIEALKAFIQQNSNDPSASEVYTTLASLYVQLDPPEFKLARNSYETAYAVAVSPNQQCDVALAEARWLASEGKVDEALARVAPIIGEQKNFGPSQMELRVMMGNLYLELGHVSKAEKVFQELVDQYADEPGGMGADADNVYRAAGLKLSRLYASTNRESEARKLRVVMRRNLKD